jgi:phytoene synthase
VQALLRHQAERARDYYRRAARALPRGDRRSLVAAEIMGAIYRALLGRIERSGYDVFSGVVRIPRPRRAFIAAATWARTALLP